ncbi:pathogenesis-related protein 1B-like [Macadamia integrifolia]|uniref:pathogenesis-related protein 1B-like n=1 Tax=Macadamia integrifolia TaxID=60698 RepID=UPI001C4F3917|nr:pathogenesis-related protein 1B-like [Macadamia integrifolia]
MAATSLTTLRLLQLPLLAAMGLVVVVVVVVDARPPPLVANFEKEMVEEHNKVRSSMGISPLTWNATVAAYAVGYVKQRSRDCELVHSKGPYGENIYWAQGTELENAAAAVKMWVDEKRDYDHATNSCINGKQCLHYTQVVSKRSQQLGCANVKCTNNNAYYVVCSYDPPGNIIGQLPY